MKPSLLVLTALGASLLAADVSAQCATQPSCSSLGFTLTSTSNCVGNVLRCPFDTSKIYCTQKSEVTGAVMPKYSNRVSRSVGTSYTASSDGYLIGVDYQHGVGGGTINIYIDNVNVRVDNQQAEWSRNSWTYPVKKGSSYRVTTSGINSTYYFVPLN